MSIGEDRAVVIVGFVARIVAPGLKPIAGVEIMIAAADENDGGEVALPPITRVTRTLRPSDRVRVGNKIDLFSDRRIYRRRLDVRHGLRIDTHMLGRDTHCFWLLRC